MIHGLELEAFSHPYLYLFILSFLLSIFISYDASKKSDSKKLYNKFFILCNITLGFWAFLVISKLILQPTILHIYAHSLVITVATINVWSLMMFIYYYTNISISKKIAWFSIIPLAFCLVLTLISFHLNFDSYDIYFTSKDIAFYTIPLEQSIPMQILITVHFIYGFIGLSVLYVFSKNQKDKNKNQYYWIMFANSIIIIGGLISAFRIDPYPDIHVYPAFFSLFFIILWHAIYNHNLFNVLPIARTKILENLMHGVIVINKDKKIIDSNKKIEQIFQKEDIYNKNIFDIHPNLKHENINFKRKNCIEDFRITNDATDKYYNISVTPLYDNESKYIGTILSFDDVTKLKENQLLLEERKENIIQQKKELKQKTNDLERQNKKLENFASVLSHDIRNPLHVSKGYLELLKNEPENTEYYNHLNNSLDRIEIIINDVLQLTKEGNEVEELTETDLKSIINESWGMLEFTDANLDMKDTITFKSDKSRLKNVLENIFRNSKDHIPENKSIKIIVGSLPNKNGFYIEDNGPGIPENKRDEVFEYGFTSEKTGTGIGLAVVKDIVNAHDWKIIATDGEQLEGTRFEIIFDK